MEKSTLHDWRLEPPRLQSKIFRKRQKIALPSWKLRDPNIAITDLLKGDIWEYITFLFEELEEPRSRLESQLKDRYKHCYLQSKSLGITSAQWISCGLHKQVFALEDTAWPRVIKLFGRPGEWQREKLIYDQHVGKGYYILPHEYREHYAVCDRVEVFYSKSSIQLAIDQGRINNRKYAKKIMERYLQGNVCNLGLYQDNLVWIDMGDFEGVL